MNVLLSSRNENRKKGKRKKKEERQRGSCDVSMRDPQLSANVMGLELRNATTIRVFDIWI